MLDLVRRDQLLAPTENCANQISNFANIAMSSTTDLLKSIQASQSGLTLAELS